MFCCFCCFVVFVVVIVVVLCVCDEMRVSVGLCKRPDLFGDGTQ